jgi:hypothetical protein
MSEASSRAAADALRTDIDSMFRQLAHTDNHNDRAALCLEIAKQLEKLSAMLHKHAAEALVKVKK